jgi:hypothetical protein
MAPKARRGSRQTYPTTDVWSGRTAASRAGLQLLPFEMGIKATSEHQIQQHRRDRQRLQDSAGFRVAHRKLGGRHLGGLTLANAA